MTLLALKGMVGLGEVKQDYELLRAFGEATTVQHIITTLKSAFFFKYLKPCLQISKRPQHSPMSVSLLGFETPCVLHMKNF